MDERYCEIKRQLEFYFSDSNLSKDRYLKKYLDKNPDGIPAHEVLKFNRLQSFNVTMEELVLCIQEIPFLELDYDTSKISRTVPVNSSIDYDSLTVYLDSLPHGCSIEKLKEIFESVGVVRNVSLPKFDNGKLKGFAFIEFSHVNEVDLCIQKFQSQFRIMPKSQWSLLKQQYKEWQSFCVENVPSFFAVGPSVEFEPLDAIYVDKTSQMCVLRFPSPASLHLFLTENYQFREMNLYEEFLYKKRKQGAD